MKRRESKAPLPPRADLLVCFPPRAHFTLMPKPIRSPVRPSQPPIAKRYHFLKEVRSNSSIIGSNDIADEPTSPRVTCAGQIKLARRKPPSCKTWQSVMEEIESVHINHTKSKKRPTWVESLGLKRDTAQFLACLERVRLDFRCFGSFPEADVASDDGEEVGINGDDGDDDRQVYDGNDDSSRAVFSKWLMLLQEDDELNHTLASGESYGKREKPGQEEEPLHREIDKTGAPPPNALRTMRCRSSPAESREQEEDEEIPSRMLAMDEENRNNSNKSLELLMRFNGIQDFCKISTEIAKETWVGGGGDFPFSSINPSCSL